MTAFDRVHPVLDCVHGLGAALKLRLMACSDDVALDEGARDIAALLTHQTRTDHGANRRELALAEALEQRWTQVAAALALGEVNVAQAQVISHALDELPANTLPAEVIRDAEAHLVARAAEFGPRELRHLGRRILDTVAPEIGEAYEAEQLAKEERRAERRTSLVCKRLGDGTTRITINRVRRGRDPAAHLPGGVHLPAAPRGGGGRPDPGRVPGGVRRSARCWRPWTRSGSRPTAEMPPP